jgi:peptidoglycan/xylan/chitin deacetylase (PgdA/CDA1 family)
LTEPHGKKTRLTTLVDNLGVTPVLKRLHDRGRDTLTILAYHRVTPMTPGREPMDVELVSATPEAFDWQMQYLRERMNPVSLTQVLEHLRGGTALPPNAAAVTFDDGFADVHEHAFPALRRHEVPATVFVITQNIETGEPFWFERAAWLMATLSPRSLHIEEVGEALPTGNDRAARTRSLRRLHAALKSISNPRREQVLAEWEQRFARCPERGNHQIGWPMTWNQIREMSAAGIEFGSHTVSHPNLAQLPAEKLLWELQESKRVLERELQREVPAFAYPFGTRQAYDDGVVTAVRQAGFGLATSYLPGTNWSHALHRYDLRRIGVELSTTAAQFRVRTALASWLG